MQAAENFVFRFRLAILALLAIFTVIMGFFAGQLRMEAGFFKQVPTAHEFIQTYFEYEGKVPGANLVLVAVRDRTGDIWNEEALTRLFHVTQAMKFMPGVDRRTVRSIWMPTIRVVQITEFGVEGENVIPGDVTIDNLTPETIAEIRERTIGGAHRGKLVADDFSAGLVLAELRETDPVTGERIDYLELAEMLESQLRTPFEDDRFEINMIGFAKFVGDMADGARDVVIFFAVAFVLTALAVFTYCRSWLLTSLAVVCSLVSVVWQFGLLTIFDMGLDPLAVLVPFLVYAIGVSHGVQQINLIATEMSMGHSADKAARATFNRLLIPGSMALVTDLVGFITLYLIPIGVIQDLAIMASLGVALKIITNLIMLPLLASYLRADPDYSAKYKQLRATRERAMSYLARIAKPRNATITLGVVAALMTVSVIETRDRKIGDLHPGRSELWPDARFNIDTHAIVESFSITVDALVVVVETPENACIKYEYMNLIDRFSWHMENVPGVSSVSSLPSKAKGLAAIWREDNPKWIAMPRGRPRLIQATGAVQPSTGLLNEICTILPTAVYLQDHKATTIDTVVAAVREFAANDPEARRLTDVNFRLGMGGVGVTAATNDVIADSELPMLAYVYMAIIVLVALAYRDWRAVICCCLPLSLATFLGYWFMTSLEIGLRVSTLPVLVLAVGIGVDYAFYIYSRIKVHLEAGADMAGAFEQALRETGVAVVFTAVTLAIGVSTWAFSSLKLQADMGLLLSFMFMANMICAITALPALAVTLDRLFPRRASGRSFAAAPAVGED